MNIMLRQIFIIARRDFLAVVATPTFLLFLLAPLFMILVAMLGGGGASQIAENTANVARIAAIADEGDARELAHTDARLRAIYDSFPTFEVKPANGPGESAARALLASKGADYVAVMYGPLEKPQIIHHPRATRSAGYLAELAEQVLRARKGDVADRTTLSKAEMTAARSAETSVAGRQTTGFLAVFGIFFLTLLLAGQSVGMLAEEKSNKVIEILAAAAPLESVFLGKLIGMFGVALLFVGFWGGMAGVALMFSGGALGATSLQPAIGLPIFVTLCALYFTMSYMLLGAIFLGVGGQAGTIREIQMLSLPITIVQVAMFSLSSAASSSPGSTIARFAEWFPLSSPLAMAARASTDPAIWPHLLALVWQGLWVGLTIWISARLFRVGVLKSGSWKSAFGFGRAKAGGV